MHAARCRPRREAYRGAPGPGESPDDCPGGATRRREAAPEQTVADALEQSRPASIGQREENGADHVVGEGAQPVAVDSARESWNTELERAAVDWMRTDRAQQTQVDPRRSRTPGSPTVAGWCAEQAVHPARVDLRVIMSPRRISPAAIAKNRGSIQASAAAAQTSDRGACPAPGLRWPRARPLDGAVPRPREARSEARVR